MSLQAFTDDQFEALQSLVRARVATMSGRKLEEDDWTSCYCAAVGALDRGWSNTDIDVVRVDDRRVLAVEQKMLGSGAQRPTALIGTRRMHPAATRRVTLDTSLNASDALNDVLGQYALVLESHRNFAAQVAREVHDIDVSPDTVELRSGWLIWARDLAEFVYFEEPLVVPEITDLRAEWKERRSGRARRGTKNLWVWSRSQGHKVFSVTDPASGTKVQPYFTVPADGSASVVRTVEEGGGAGERVWLDPATAAGLAAEIARLDEGSEPPVGLRAVCEAWLARHDAETFASADLGPVRVDVDSTTIEILDAELPGLNRQSQLELILRDLTRQT